MSSLFTQVTVVPTGTVISAALKVKLSILTVVADAATAWVLMTLGAGAAAPSATAASTATAADGTQRIGLKRMVFQALGSSGRKGGEVVAGGQARLWSTTARVSLPGL